MGNSGESIQSAADPVRSEEWHRILVELAPDVLYSISPDGRFVALSPAFEWVTGFPVEEWVGRSFAELIHPADLPLALERFHDHLAGRRTPPYELRVRSKSGEYLVGEIRAMPRIEGDQVTGTIGVARDITERKQIETALLTLQEEHRRSRDQLETILQTVDDGITVQNAIGKVIYANAMAARLTGFNSAAELIEQQGTIPARFTMFDHDGAPVDLEQLPGRRVLHGESACELEVGFRTASGEERWSLIKARPVNGENGSVELVVNVIQDITERRRVQTVQEQLAAIVESSNDAIIGKTLDAVVTSWNPAAQILYGYTAEEMIGRSLEVLVPPDRPNELQSLMARVRRGERIQDFETIRVRKDGQHLDVSLSISSIREASGRIVGAATIGRDITAQKRAEAERVSILEREKQARERAEASQARLAFLARASEILASSLDYDTTLANVASLAVPQLADLCVIDLFDDSGALRRVALTHPDPDKLEWIKDFEKRYPTDPLGPDSVLRTGRSQLIPEITEAMLHELARSEQHLADLRTFNVSSIMAVALTVRDRVIGQLGLLSLDSGRHYGPNDLSLAEDLARRVATAVDNARLYHETQRALRLRDEFLSIASHELKTPLTALQLQVQVIEHALTSAPDTAFDRARVSRFMEGAWRQMRRLARLINDLLDVSRLSSGKRELQLEETDLGALVQEVAERFSTEAAITGSAITLKLELAVNVRVDRFQIDQVITNLLSNAIKYGGGNRIDVRLGREGSTARLAVHDLGIGIATEHLALVFDRFERVTLSQSYGGLGLGLYIARQIVEAHGGTIGVESSPEKGTTFTVELPMSCEDSSQP